MTKQPLNSHRPADNLMGTPLGEGAKAKREALLFGVVGLVFLGVVCGPLALMRAKKAESLGEKATAAKVLGWIDLVLGAFAIVGLFLNFA